MIKIDRTQVSEPNILASNNSDPNGEKQQAIKFHELGIGNKVAFKLYTNHEVKHALKIVFKDKCAYCESIVSHVSYLHIEHWRPKGGVKDEPKHVGYYWLASQWDNLLLACAICNSQEYKGNHFPLKLGSTYALKSSDDHTILEQPLLIDPCTTDPIDHFIYDRFGTVKGVSDEGRTSVRIYGLQRTLLTVERRKWAEIVVGYLEDILWHISDASNTLDDSSRLSHIKKKIKSKADSLKQYISSGFQYAGMNRTIILDYKNKYAKNLIFQKVIEEIMLSI